MEGLISETEFIRYLEDQRLPYTRDYKVGPGEFDFRIEGHSGPIYCDVKEIRDSDIESLGEVDAHFHLRGDIRKLRSKYRGKSLNSPVILVSMNFLSNCFTGLTVAKALMGDTEVRLDRCTLQVIRPLHHSKNAVFTKHHNTSISGIFVFDRVNRSHCFFENPYNTKISLLKTTFRGLRFIPLHRGAMGQELIDLGEFWFPNVHGDEKIIHKGHELEEEIMGLFVGNHETWKWENPHNLSLKDPHFQILVRTYFPAGTKRPYPEIKSFRDKLERILRRYCLKIQDWYDENSTYDAETDKKYRRIDIEVTRMN